MGLFNYLFSPARRGGDKTKKIQDFKSRGAIILDVRTQKEYDNGAIPGSKHIPLQELNSRINEVKILNKPIITCCQSGVRSASAVTLLRNNGVETTNGGGWMALRKML